MMNEVNVSSAGKVTGGVAAGRMPAIKNPANAVPRSDDMKTTTSNIKMSVGGSPVRGN